MYPERVVSSMRPTESLHLGHYFGGLQKWLKLQAETPCMFFVADWQALTTHFDDAQSIEEKSWEMLLDWLAAGIDPSQATLFIQSHVPEHAELHLLLSMATPLSWLQESPSFLAHVAKSSQAASYALLGEACLRAADVLIYRASSVALAPDEMDAVAMMGEMARRFNHLYGKEKDFEEKSQLAVKKLGSKRAKLYMELRAEYQEQGIDEALAQAKAVLDDAQNLSMIDRERLFGYLEGSRMLILVEPDGLELSPSQMPGFDGQPMTYALKNHIALRETRQSVERKVRSMATDPQRTQGQLRGNPAHCSVWPMQRAMTNAESSERVRQGCISGRLSCVECKRMLCDAIALVQEPIHERAQAYLDDPSLVRAIVADGCDSARKLAQETMRDVRDAMGLNYSL